ncbi:hypothetical protein [Aeromicrobium sp. UC242_57]
MAMVNQPSYDPNKPRATTSPPCRSRGTSSPPTTTSRCSTG